MLMVMSDHNVIGLMAQLMVGEVVLYKKAVLVRFLRITDHLLSRFYRTRVRSLAMLVTHSLPNSLTNSLLFSGLDGCP